MRSPQNNCALCTVDCKLQPGFVDVIITLIILFATAGYGVCSYCNIYLTHFPTFLLYCSHIDFIQYDYTKCEGDVVMKKVLLIFTIGALVLSLAVPVALAEPEGQRRLFPRFNHTMTRGEKLGIDWSFFPRYDEALELEEAAENWATGLMAEVKELRQALSNGEITKEEFDEALTALGIDPALEQGRLKAAFENSGLFGLTTEMREELESFTEEQRQQAHYYVFSYRHHLMSYDDLVENLASLGLSILEAPPQVRINWGATEYAADIEEIAKDILNGEIINPSDIREVIKPYLEAIHKAVQDLQMQFKNGEINLDTLKEELASIGITWQPRPIKSR